MLGLTAWLLVAFLAAGGVTRWMRIELGAFDSTVEKLERDHARGEGRSR